MIVISENILKNNMERAWLKSVLNKTFYAALAVFFFLLPLQTRWIFREVPLYEYGALSVFLVEVIGWVVVVLGAIKIQEYKNIKIGNSLFLYPCVLVFLAFLSVAWAPDKAVALQAAMRLLEGILLFSVLRYTLYATRYTIIYAFLAGAVFQAGLGIYQFLTQSSFSSTILGMALHDPQMLGTSVVEFGDERWLRAYGGLPHPNVFGGYLVVALVILLCGNIKIQKYKNILRYGITAILLTGIFFSFSRAAWVAAGFSMIFNMVWQFCEYNTFARTSKSVIQRFYNPIIIYTLLIIFYLGLLVIIFRPLVTARLFPESRLEVKSRVERVQGVGEAWKIIKAHPLVGVGIGNYTQALQQLRPDQPLYAYQPVHNVPLLILAELGTLGLILFFLVLYTLWCQSKNYLLLTTFYVLLMTMDHYLWTLPFGILLFWGILGLSTIIHRPRT